MCVYQFRHLGNATYNFTFPPDTCQRSHPSPPSLRPRTNRFAQEIRVRDRPAAAETGCGRLAAQPRRPPLARRRHRSRAAAVARGDPGGAAQCRHAAAPCRPRARTRRRTASRAKRSMAAWRRWSATASSSPTARASCASSPSSTSSSAPCRDIPTASDSSFRTKAATTIFLSPREMHKVLHGDRAALRKSGIDRRGRPEGEIVEVLERANREVVGRLYEERGIWFVVAENRRINQDFLVPAGDLGGAKVGAGGRRGDRRAAGRQSRGDRAHQGSARQRDRFRHRNRDRAAQARAAVRVLDKDAERQAQAPARPRCAPPTARIASTSPRCRSSPSTARPRRTSTTPSTASARAGTSA